MQRSAKTSQKTIQDSEKHASILDQTFEGASFLAKIDSGNAADHSPKQEQIILLKNGNTDVYSHLLNNRPDSTWNHRKLKGIPNLMTKSPSLKNRSFILRDKSLGHNKSQRYDNSFRLDPSGDEILPSVNKNALLHIELDSKLQNKADSISKPHMGLSKSRKTNKFRNNSTEDTHQTKLFNVYKQKLWSEPGQSHPKHKPKRRWHKFEEDVSEDDAINPNVSRSPNKSRQKFLPPKVALGYIKDKPNTTSLGHRNLSQPTELNILEDLNPSKESLQIVIEPSVLGVHHEEMESQKLSKMRCSSMQDYHSFNQELHQVQAEANGKKNNQHETIATVIKPDFKHASNRAAKTHLTIDVHESNSTKVESESTLCENKEKDKNLSHEPKQNSSLLVRLLPKNRISRPKLKDTNQKYLELMQNLDMKWRFREIQGMIRKARKSLVPKKVSWDGS